MKIKLLSFIAGLWILAGALTSCLESDVEEIVYSPESSITAFSVGTLYRTFLAKDSLGNDSLFVDSLDLSNYPFAINQLTREIENKDSLPVGTHIDKVLVNVTSDTGMVIYRKRTSKEDVGVDTLLTTTDSLDFTLGPIELKVMTYDGTLGAPYRVKVNVHQQEPDSLQWSLPFERSFVSGPLSHQKALYVGNKLIVFGSTADHQPVAEYLTFSYQYAGTVAVQAEPARWQQVTLPTGTDPYTAVQLQDAVYFLAGGSLYVFRPETATVEPADCGTVPDGLSQLLAGPTCKSGSYLYARNTDGHSWVYATATGQWTDEGPTEFPGGTDTRVVSAVVPVSYNANFVNVVTLSQNAVATDSTAVVATRLTNDTSWRVLKSPADSLSCPNLVDPTLLYYDQVLYAFGGQAVNNTYTYAPFAKLFVSVNNGLTWEPVETGATFPEDNETFTHYYNKEMAGGYSCTTDNEQFIWIVWTDGTLTRGRVNRLGFQPKW